MHKISEYSPNEKFLKLRDTASLIEYRPMLAQIDIGYTVNIA